jgi:hypothetical protein
MALLASVLVPYFPTILYLLGLGEWVMIAQLRPPRFR